MSQDEESGLPCGTIYSRNPEDLLAGLPSEESYRRDLARPWLTCDKTDYAARGLFGGRASGLQTAYCPRRRFIPTPIYSEPAADEGDQVKERLSTTANLYSGSLEQ